MDKDVLKTAGSGIGIQGTNVQFVYTQSQEMLHIYAVCRAVWMVLQFIVVVGCYCFIQRRISDPESHHLEHSILCSLFYLTDKWYCTIHMLFIILGGSTVISICCTIYAFY